MLALSSQQQAVQTKRRAWLADMCREGGQRERVGSVHGKEESWERWGDRELRHRQRKRKVGVRVSINKKFTSFVYMYMHTTCRLFVKLSSTYLRSPVYTAKESVRQHFTTADVFHPPQPATKAQPCSVAIDVHYFFDMAQQVFYPNDPLQPGLVYTKKVSYLWNVL